MGFHGVVVGPTTHVELCYRLAVDVSLAFFFFFLFLRFSSLLPFTWELDDVETFRAC